MAVNNLPPQAYTRETLTNAIEWLRTQTASTKELASKDTNSLVALYLQANRYKDRKVVNTTDTPKFQDELKNIANGIKQFTQDESAPVATRPPAAIPVKPRAEPSSPILNFIDNKPKLHVRLEPTPDAIPAHNPAPAALPHAPVKSKFINPEDYLKKHGQNNLEAVTAKLSPLTLKIISKTKTSMNLSSDEEAMNVLIAIGYEKIKGIFEL